MSNFTSGNPYHLLKLEFAPSYPLPAGKRLPKGWSAFPVSAANQDGKTRLSCTSLRTSERLPVRLRLSVALDDREDRILKVISSKTRQELGVLDIRQAHVFQPFELQLSTDQLNSLLNEGITLEMEKGNEPIWFFLSSPVLDGCPSLMPHLLLPIRQLPLMAFLDRMFSLASLQFFGWQEGVVLDGLFDLSRALPWSAARQTIKDHFDQFFDAAGNLCAEDDYSRPVDGEIYGIEATLPYATLAQIDPGHPMLRKVVDYWQKNMTASGLVQDAQGSYFSGSAMTDQNIVAGSTTTAEGAYTIAYPMAVIANLTGDLELAQLAAQQLRVRKQLLIEGDSIYLRRHSDGSRNFRNWSRGVAWYYLGLVRTLIHLPSEIEQDDLRVEVQRVSRIVLSQQLDHGMWACFLDRPGVLPDTTGSSGLATALALAVRYNFLDPQALAHARQAFQSISRHLTPDGFLGGVAQANKGGEALQTANYRVISQFGMGLFAQLLAALLPEGIESPEELLTFLSGKLL
jgi:rhamnogalacturonyl hydrolase YesR